MAKNIPRFKAQGLPDPTTENYLNGYFILPAESEDQDLREIRAVGQTIRSTFVEIFKYDKKVRANPTLSEPEQLYRAGDYAQRKISEAKALAVKLAETLAPKLKELDDDLAARLRPDESAAQQTVNERLRRKLDELAPEARRDVIKHAIEAGDHVLAKASLEVGALGIGLEPPIYEQRKAEYLAATAKAQVDRRKAFDEAFERLDYSIRQLDLHTGDVVDWDRFAVISKQVKESEL